MCGRSKRNSPPQRQVSKDGCHWMKFFEKENKILWRRY